MPEQHRCLPKCQVGFIVPDAGESADTSVVEKRMEWAAEIENVDGAEERGR